MLSDLHSILPYVLASLTLFGSSALAAPETLDSIDGDSLFTCPDRETIEVAYASYCPSDTTTNVALSGVYTGIDYENAPASYQSTEGSYILGCAYDDGSNLIVCSYNGGAGLSLAPSDSQDDRCRDVSDVVPQPSPGVDYRRRALIRRADQPPPEFVCPFYVDNGFHLWSTTTRTGFYTEGDQLDPTYSCMYYNEDNTVQFSCDYQRDPSQQANVDDNDGRCPAGLCTALRTGSGNMRRGLFVGDSPTVRRQAKAADVRARSQEKAKVKAPSSSFRRWGAKA